MGKNLPVDIAIWLSNASAIERKTAFKGQLILKCPFGVTLSTKIATKLLSGFLPYYIRLYNRAEILTKITLLFWSKHLQQIRKAVIALSPDENWSKCTYVAANNSVADLYSSPATVLLQNCYRRKKNCTQSSSVVILIWNSYDFFSLICCGTIMRANARTTMSHRRRRRTKLGRLPS